MKKSSGPHNNSIIGRIAYGTVFVVFLPWLLWIWARALHSQFQHWLIPVSPNSGFLIASAGMVVMLLGMWALWAWGEGLPMNAYPPARFVTAGVYRWLPHPIYTGFILFCFGVSAWLNLPAGFWLVSPLVIAGCLALVWGYENPDLVRRFPEARATSWLRLPPNTLESPDFLERVAGFFLTLFPWGLVYVLLALIPSAPDLREVRGLWEFDVPRPGWALWPYNFAYGWVVLALLIVPSRQKLRDFVLDGWVLSLTGYVVMPGLPFAAAALPIVGTPFEQALWVANCECDAPWLAVPSFHVAWSVLACIPFADRWPRLRWVWWLIVASISISCVLVGLHGSLDVVTGIALAGLAHNRQIVWGKLLAATEYLGNSWHSWQFGGYRIINHGLFSGLGGAIGSGLAVYLVGDQLALWIFWGILVSLFGAGLWGQLVEGSSKLLRPFGYYGFLFGGILAITCMVMVYPEQGAIVGAATVTAGTIAQAIGRLRCIIQGCCHGRPAPDQFGIHIHHPRSRVSALAKLQGVAVYPTQLFSILANCVIGLWLLRLWSIQAPAPMIIGLYFILSALTRFVEESYRGEPQTRVISGLAIYQWLAIGCLIGGAIVTTLPGPSVHMAGASGFRLWTIAIFAGGLAAFLMSTDFPNSDRRLARLTID